MVQARAGWGTAVQFLVGFGVSGCSETAHLAMERVLMSPGGRTNGLLECFFFVNLSEVFCIIHSGISYAVSIMYILYIMYRHLLQIYIYIYIHINTHMCIHKHTYMHYMICGIFDCRLPTPIRNEVLSVAMAPKTRLQVPFLGRRKGETESSGVPSFDTSNRNPKKTRVTACSKSAR